MNFRVKKNEEKEKFYKDLTAEVQSRKGKCFVLGDFNGRVGSSTCGCDGVHGGFEWVERSRNDERVLEFADSFEMVVGDTFFKTDTEKLITYKSGDCATGVDYDVVPKEAMKNVKTCEGNPWKGMFFAKKVAHHEFDVGIQIVHYCYS